MLTCIGTAKSHRLHLVVMTLLLLAPALCAGDDGIRIIEHDRNGLIVELDLPPYQVDDVEGPDGAYQRIRLPGWARTIEPGSPELPRTGILIQVPAEGSIDLDILESRYEVLNGCVIYPVPELSVSGDGTRCETFKKSASVYDSEENFPRSPAVIEPRAVIRGVPVARIVFSPFQWNPRTCELRCFETIRIQVRFSRPLPVADQAVADDADSVFDEMLREMIPNYAGRPRGNLEPRRRAGRAGCTRSVKSGLRMEIDETGIHRLTHDDLLAAGVEVQNIDPRTFQVFFLGEEAAIDVRTADPHLFAPGDQIAFHAEAIAHNIFTETNVYWLYWGAEKGKRMVWASGEVTGSGVPVEFFDEALHVETDTNLWEGVPGATSVDYWFWEKIYAPDSIDYTLSVPSPDPAQDDAILRICFQGASTASPHPNHHTEIFVNGTFVGDEFWDGATIFVQEMVIPQGVLVDGDNRVTISLPHDTGAPIDIIWLNWFELDYRRAYETVGDELAFAVEGSDRFCVDVGPFGTRRIRIFDITDPYGIEKIGAFSHQSRGGARAQAYEQIDPEVHSGSFRALFETDVAGSKRFYAMTANGYRTPARLEYWEFSNLKNTARGADYILVTSRLFQPDLAPLWQFRALQGLRVETVATEDIYNEFNHGIFHPSALKDFLQYAYDNWTRPAPVYVLFVGDANTNYRDLWNTGKENIVPVHLFESDLGVTPNDTWYACVDGGDDLPDMFLRMIPANSAAMAAQMAGKVVAYGQSMSYDPDGVLLSADDEPAFETLNEELLPYLPTNFYADKVYLSNYGNVNDATQDIITSIDGGVMITHYAGHGSVTNWAGEYMWVSSDIDDLNNGHSLTFVVTMTCLNGYFSQPFVYCIAEEFVAAADKGAIGCFAPSGLGYVWEHDILGKEIFSIIFDQHQRNMGYVTTRSKIEAYVKGASLEQVQLFTLFGDPAAEFKEWN